MAPVKTFLRPVICSLVVTLICGVAAVRAQPVVSTTRDAFVHPNLIVSVSWLMQHTTDPHLRIVDARPTAEYDKGHIPGAVSLPVAGGISGGRCAGQVQRPHAWRGEH